MNKIVKNFKKQTLTFILAFMLMLTSFVGLISFVNLSKKEVFAENSAYDSVSISNSNFDSNSDTDLSEPNSFTAVGTKGSTTSGVIDVDPTTFNDNKESYKLNFNPSKPNVSEDNKILMINNENILSSYGYESSTFTLEQNRYYMISVYVFTQYDKTNASNENDENQTNLTSTASLYLSSTTLDNLEESKIENISTRGVWQEYRFYVQTNNESLTTKLVLYIGSKNSFKSAGAVFFDNINAYSLTEEQYYNEMKSSLVLSKKITLENKDVSINNNILNGDFENGSFTTDFEKETLSDVSSVGNIAEVVGIGEGYFDKEYSKVDTDPTNANRTNNTKALLINNQTKSKTTFVSNDILIERHKLYVLSLDVKTSSFSSGGAIIELNQQNPYSDEYEFTPESKNFTSVSTSDQTNSVLNDWITYSFFITGNAFKDSYARLTIGLDENAVGYAFFDNIKLFEITSEEFENNSSNSNCVEADFTGITGTDSIANSSFNNIDFASTNESSPYKAKDWTVSNDETENNYNGIIDEYLNHQNVFVLANTEMGYQSLKSSDFTENLTASTLDETNYYKLTFDINTNGILYSGANVTIKNSSGNVLAKLNAINTNNAWQTVTFLFKTSTNEETINITIELGTSTKNEKGYAYVDNFMLEESTETEFNDAVSSKTLSKTDLSKVDLTLKSENAVNNVYSADNFTGTKNSSLPAEVEAGIININSYSSLNASSENDYVLMIHNIQDAYYTLKSNGYSLTSENFYKITARVRTINLKQDDANKQFDEDNNAYKFGAKISLNGISAETEIIEENSDFTTYTFFISATTDTNIYFELSLGSENAICSGYALFDNLSVTQISEDDFKTAQDNFDEDDKNTIIIGSTDESEETDDDDADNGSSAINFDWLVLPTLIIGVALLIAMVGLLIRKLNIKLPVRAGVKDYDRAKTLVKEHEKREKMIAREKRLQLLREKLAELENEIQQNQIEYKNSKSLKQEIKVEHEKVEKQIKEKYVDTSSIEALKEERKLKIEAKNKVKQLRKERFEAKRIELIAKFEEIEKEIEMILEEERLLVEQWKAYKKEQKALKKANRENKKKK